MHPSLPPDELARISQALFQGQKIQAIKLYRRITGSGLKEAKDAIEAIESDLRAKSPEQFLKQASQTGCLGILIAGCAISGLALWTTLFAATKELPVQPPCRIEVVEKGTRWPVPLVELRTTHNVRFVTDNAGIIAFDLPELMGKETWFDVIGHGYEVPRDGFGSRGVRLKPEHGKTIRVEVNRTIIAKRLGRLTGGGLFAESQKLGLEPQWRESGILGCDSVQNAVHRGKLFWAWGDTTLTHYPLGIFDMTSATTAPQPLNSFEPPLKLQFNYFTDKHGKPRGVAKMPGSGPTWVSAYVSLPDKSGRPRLVGTYIKVKPPMEAYESGLCIWNDNSESFEPHRILWTKSEATPKSPPTPDGHPAFWKDGDGKEWVLFGNPLPTLRCRATFRSLGRPVRLGKAQTAREPAFGCRGNSH